MIISSRPAKTSNTGKLPAKKRRRLSSSSRGAIVLEGDPESEEEDGSPVTSPTAGPRRANPSSDGEVQSPRANQSAEAQARSASRTAMLSLNDMIDRGTSESQISVKPFTQCLELHGRCLVRYVSDA